MVVVGVAVGRRYPSQSSIIKKQTRTGLQLSGLDRDAFPDPYHRRSGQTRGQRFLSWTLFWSSCAAVHTCRAERGNREGRGLQSRRG